MNQKNRRQKLFVEPRMQGLLVFKVLLYWVNSFLTIGLLIAAWSVFTNGPSTATELLHNIVGSVGPALAASLVLLPLILLDCIRWSNRYAGPMVRLHTALRELANGKQVDSLEFREGDLWFEMATEFNRIATRIDESNSTPQEPAPQELALEEPALAQETCESELLHV